MSKVFISYGGPDEDFAERLSSALERHGIETYFFPKSAKFGNRMHREMRDNINSYDRFVLVCSQSSLSRPGVANELEEVFAREASEGGRSIIIPIALDRHVYGDWKSNNPGVDLALRQRVIADFTDAVHNETEFDKGVSRLAAAIFEGRGTTLLEYKDTIDLSNFEQSSRAFWNITRREKVIRGSVGLLTYRDILPRGKLISITSNDGAVTEEWRGGSRHVELRFPRPYKEGEIYSATITIEIEGGYSNHDEANTRISSDWQSYVCDVVLPAKRPATQIEAYRDYRDSIVPLQLNSISSDKSAFSLAVKFPHEGATYGVRWKW